MYDRQIDISHLISNIQLDFVFVAVAEIETRQSRIYLAALASVIPIVSIWYGIR